MWQRFDVHVSKVAFQMKKVDLGPTERFIPLTHSFSLNFQIFHCKRVYLDVISQSYAKVGKIHHQCSKLKQVA